MTQFPDLYLLRHGETEWNRERRMQGRLDSPLTEGGRAQMAALAPLMKEIEADAYVSPLKRALDSASLAIPDRVSTDDPRLVEIDIGDFSGHRYDDLRKAHPEYFQMPELSWYDVAPNGEGLAGLALRCGSFLAELQAPAIIVTHGITLRMLRLIAMGQDMSEFERDPVIQGGIHVIKNGQEEVWSSPK